MYFEGSKEKKPKVKKVKKKSKKTELRELDDMWKHKVKYRDEWMCQICKKKVVGKNCHAHHILPKGIKGMRWDVSNGITLCYQHPKVGHWSAHMNAIWFTFWLKTNKNAQFKYVIDKMTKLGSR